MKIYLLLTFLFLSFASQAQAPDWSWARGEGDVAHETSTDIATDAAGNSYVTGYYTSATISFGSFVLTNSQSGKADIFIVKYDADGNVLWAKSAGGDKDDYSYAIALDDNGNCYIVGSFISYSIYFDALLCYKTSPTYTNSDGFIAKYSSSGNATWAKGAYGMYNESVADVAIDANGNCFVTGCFISPALSFDNLFIVLSPGESKCIFIAKFDSAGNEIWVKIAGNSGADVSKSISVDAHGNSVIAGDFTSAQIAFDSLQVSNSNPSGSDIFIAKYDSAGNPVWVKSAGNSLEEIVLDVSMDSIGNTYTTGYFTSNTFSFGSIVLTNTQSIFSDLFIVKHDTTGNVIWAKSAGGSNDEIAHAIVTDRGGNSYIAGEFSSATLVFGTTTLTNVNYSLGYKDCFVAKYDSSGNALWVKQAAGVYSEAGIGVGIDSTGNSYITGIFESALNFGSIAVTGPFPSSQDIFVARVNDKPTGINPIDFDAAVVVFPNPSTGKFTLSASTAIEQVEITNALGQLIYAAAPGRKEVLLSLDAGGIYFVAIHCKENSATRKIIVAQ